MNVIRSYRLLDSKCHCRQNRKNKFKVLFPSRFPLRTYFVLVVIDSFDYCTQGVIFGNLYCWLSNFDVVLIVLSRNYRLVESIFGIKSRHYIFTRGKKGEQNYLTCQLASSNYQRRRVFRRSFSQQCLLLPNKEKLRLCNW